MAIEDRIREARAGISLAQGKVVRAQVEHDNAVIRRDEAKKTLKEEFGVATNEDAKRILTELEEKLETAVSEVETALEEAGA